MTKYIYIHICINRKLMFQKITLLLHKRLSIPFHSRFSYSILLYPISLHPFFFFNFNVCVTHYIDSYDPPNGLQPGKNDRIIATPVVLNRVRVQEYLTVSRGVWGCHSYWHLVDRGQGCCKMHRTAPHNKIMPPQMSLVLPLRNFTLYLALF